MMPTRVAQRLVGALLGLFVLACAQNLAKAAELAPNEVALLLAGTLGYVLIDTFRDERLPQSFDAGNLADPAGTRAITSVSDSIFGDYLLPFWALSFVLLAAVIGAIVLARKD